MIIVPQQSTSKFQEKYTDSPATAPSLRYSAEEYCGQNTIIVALPKSKSASKHTLSGTGAENFGNATSEPFQTPLSDNSQLANDVTETPKSLQEMVQAGRVRFEDVKQRYATQNCVN